MDLKETVLKTILQRDPPLIAIGAGERVLVAVSGGPDSLALLHVLIDLKETLGLEWLGVAHADHGLRGVESDADCAFVESFCAHRGIPCSTGHVDIPTLRERHGVGIEEAARIGRYAFLEDASARARATRIATAHTQDDRVETVLLHILRGTGLEGLKGIPYQRNAFIRPLLDVDRGSVEAYCREHNLAPRIDSSNADTSLATRNRIRHELLPALERDYNSRVRRALISLSEIAARDSEYLTATARTLMLDMAIGISHGGLRLDGARLLAQPYAMQHHILRSAIYAVRGSLEFVGADGLDAVLGALRDGRSFCLTTPQPHARLLVKPEEVTVVLGLTNHSPTRVDHTP